MNGSESVAMNIVKCPLVINNRSSKMPVIADNLRLFLDRGRSHQIICNAKLSDNQPNLIANLIIQIICNGIAKIAKWL